MSYLRYLNLLANSGVQHISCCVFCLFVCIRLYLVYAMLFKIKHLLVSESYCTIAIVLLIYVSYTNTICLYQDRNFARDFLYVHV
jgi:hypothetical protein